MRIRFLNEMVGNTFYGASEELDAVSRALDGIDRSIRRTREGLYNMSAATIHNKAMKSLRQEEEIKEKPFVLPSDAFEAIDLDTMDGVVSERTHMVPRFIEGEKYSLQGIACDGFEMPIKVYRLVSVVKDFYGVPIDSVIMKQIEGEREQIFTLSKNDCLHLGIEYEDGLQPFPMDMHWERIVEKVPFNPKDLSTSARSKVDNTIRHILLRINGFKDYLDGFVLSPSGKLINESVFINTLKVKNVEPIVYGNGYVDREYSQVRSEVVYPKTHLFTHANFISQNDDVFILLTLSHHSRRCIDLKAKEACVDNYFGVEPKYLKGINPNDFFTIEWDEATAITLEQYEKSKKEKLEKQRRKEEERKKRQAENERKKMQILQKLNSDVRAVLPFPNAPKLDLSFDTLSDMDIYIKGVNDYFFTVGNALNSIDMMIKSNRI